MEFLSNYNFLPVHSISH